MKRWYFPSLILVLALSVPNCALAGPDDDWTVFLRPRTDTGVTGQIGMFGTKTGASDGIDSNDAVLPVGGEVFIASVDLGPQYHIRDIKEPVDWNEVKVWNLKLWLAPTSVATQIQLAGWTVGLNGVLPVRLEVYPLTSGMTYYFDSAQPGGATVPAFEWVFDGTTHKGFENAIDLCLIAGPAVPEPASLAAMLCGLAGLAGWMRRRK